MLPAYAELHCLSNFSFLRGASHPEELVERAHALGYSALAITDECSVAGVVRAHFAAKETGLPLVIGSEFTLADGVKLVLLATDRASYGDLAQLITRGRRRRPRARYALTRDDVAALAPRLPRAVGARRTYRRAQRNETDDSRRARRRPPAGSPRRSRTRLDRGRALRPRRRPRAARASRRRSRARPGCRWSPPATSTCMCARGARCRTRSPRSA